MQTKKLMTPEEVFAISGQTKLGGMSKGHEFVVTKPYMYPLFKLHKLTEQQIQQKIVPPTRMVTSGVGGPTYRLGVFLDALLKPVVQMYCQGELIKDSTDFLIELKKMEQNGTSRMKSIGTLDVDALYPSIRVELAIQALHDALSCVTGYSPEQVQMILKLARICLENSMVHYRGQWYKSKQGIPTGGPESSGIANIVVYFVLEKILLVHPKIQPLNRLSSRKRFLDDLFFGWLGTERQFSVFRQTLNAVGKGHGITFKGEVGASVDFLDTTVTLHPDGTLTTKMYVKPTDASRYLHRRSDHSPHTFRSIPFSQFRRAVVLCSDPQEKLKCIEYIGQKLKNSGFKKDEIDEAKKKALSLNRDIILTTDRLQSKQNDDKKLTFLINRDGFMSKEIKKLMKECNPDINKLLGKETRIVVAERKNCSIASEVFAKSSFSKNVGTLKETQKCGGGNGCKSCEIMNLERSVTVWKGDPKEKNVKLDFRCDCTTELAIYIYVCNLCKNNESFYIGQTVNSCRSRANGHRGRFNWGNFKKSALSHHMYRDHPEHINKKLSIYSLGIIKSSSPSDIDRLEDYYVEHLDAKLSLNRYKVVS